MRKILGIGFVLAMVAGVTQAAPLLVLDAPTQVNINDTFVVTVDLNSPPDTLQSVSGMVEFDDAKLDFVSVTYHSSIPTACGALQQPRSGCWFHFVNPASPGDLVYIKTSDDFSLPVVIGGCPDAEGTGEWDPVFPSGNFQYATITLKAVASGQAWVMWKDTGFSSDYWIGYGYYSAPGVCEPGIAIGNQTAGTSPAKGVKKYIQVQVSGGGGGGGGELSKSHTTWATVKKLYQP